MEDDAKNNVLEDAEQAVFSRKTNYGDKLNGPTAAVYITAELWSNYLQTDLTEHDICMMMVLLKVARAKVDPKKRDNLVDIAGYVRVAELSGKESFEAHLRDIAAGGVTDEEVTAIQRRNPESLK